MLKLELNACKSTVMFHCRAASADITMEMPRVQLGHCLANCLVGSGMAPTSALKTRHLYGWVFQMCPQPSVAYRGALNSGGVRLL